jgi:hypothetical protein
VIAVRVCLGPCEVDRIIERSSIGHVRTSGAVTDTTVTAMTSTATATMGITRTGHDRRGLGDHDDDRYGQQETGWRVLGVDRAAGWRRGLTDSVLDSSAGLRHRGHAR